MLGVELRASCMLGKHTSPKNIFLKAKFSGELKQRRDWQWGQIWVRMLVASLSAHKRWRLHINHVGLVLRWQPCDATLLLSMKTKSTFSFLGNWPDWKWTLQNGVEQLPRYTLWASNSFENQDVPQKRFSHKQTRASKKWWLAWNSKSEDRALLPHEGVCYMPEQQ